MEFAVPNERREESLAQIERTQKQLRASIEQTKQLLDKIRILLRRARRNQSLG